MRQLVRRGRGVALGVTKRLGHRELDDVELRAVIGAVSAMADSGSGGSDERLGRGNPLDRVGLRLGLRHVLRWKVLDLGDVENRIGIQERDRALEFLAGVGGVPPTMRSA